MVEQRSLRSDRRTVLGGVATSLGMVSLAGCTDAAGDDTTDDGEADETGADADMEATDDGDGTENGTDDDSSEIHAEYESTDVQVTTPDGDVLGEVTAAIADTDELRRLGLSDTEELPDDRGMLFVYESVDERVFGMPEMSFGIDIIFADDEGSITTIHNAPEPEEGDDEADNLYPGEGQYVLEVVYEWTDDHDVSEGDILEFEL